MRKPGRKHSNKQPGYRVNTRHSACLLELQSGAGARGQGLARGSPFSLVEAESGVWKQNDSVL